MFGKPSTMLWPGTAAAILAVSWLLPNHTPPWNFFHADAWVLFWALGLGAWVVHRCGTHHQWPRAAVVALGVAVVPLVQWQLGLIASSGEAIISAGYMLACSLCIVMGYQLYRFSPHLPGHILFSAIALACVLNVGIQLKQWLGIHLGATLSWAWILIRDLPPGVRPSGNMFQPNHLATLLVWGLLAGVWAYVHRAIRLNVLLLYSVFLAFGLGLTQSRIGLIELAGLCLAAIYWRRLLPSNRIVYGALALLALTLCLFVALPVASDWLNIGSVARDLKDVWQDNTRAQAYRIFWDSALAQPWWGYGMSHVSEAYLRAASTQTYQGMYFIHSHNVFLDALLWFGFPLGLLLLGLLILWVFRSMSRVMDLGQLLLLLLVLCLGLHALVELPHQFAYFLVPACIAMGAINQPSNHDAGWPLPRYVLGIALLGCAMLYACVVDDYLETEERFTELRFEKAKIGPPLGIPVPQLWVLSQMEDMLTLLRTTASKNMSAAQVEWAGRAVRGEPSPSNFFTYIEILALNGRKNEALQWMHKLNAIAESRQLPTLQKDWALVQQRYPELADLAWPVVVLAPKK